jgi:hypothetical protein
MAATGTRRGRGQRGREGGQGWPRRGHGGGTRAVLRSAAKDGRGGDTEGARAVMRRAAIDGRDEDTER